MNKVRIIQCSVFLVASTSLLSCNQAVSTDSGIVPAVSVRPFEYKTVVSAGQTWMDRNLGASRVATSPNDSEAYGDLYQWGRPADGHEKRTSSTTSTLSPSDIPGDDSFILVPNSPYDWRTPQNNKLWQGVSGMNNPCPSGFRLPTEKELTTELKSWGSSNKNSAAAFASPLKLVMAGYRNYSDGTIRTDNGHYWSSTVSGNNLSRYLYFVSGSAATKENIRAYGFSVRCIKD